MILDIFKYDMYNLKTYEDVEKYFKSHLQQININ